MGVNDKILDAEVSHQIGLIRYGNGIVNKIIALLKRTDSDLYAQLIKQLERLPESPSVERIDEQLKAIRNINEKAYQSVADELDVSLSELTSYELGYQANLFDNAVPLALDFTRPSSRQVYAAAMARPFQGRLLSEWVNGLEADASAKIRDAVRIGFVEGQTIPQITKRIRGSRALNYEDGILAINKRNAESVVRTAVAHTANYARESFYDENQDLIKGYRYTATLDARTTELCASRDGKVYRLDQAKPSLPAHFNCRSTYTVVIKSWQELGFDADEVPQSTRASMDGQVPESLTYQEWLRKKPAKFQDEVLGKTKGRLFREGMTLDRFVNERGKVYTLKELERLDGEFFN
jgi:SPP1 gp7 family putative phage head morphogenesis protein